MERRVVVRILFNKLDIEKLPELVAVLEETAEAIAPAEVEYNILPERPAL
jgi:hypothetical protein